MTPEQRALIDAVADRFIPPDELGPGAAAAGVADYIERFLAGPEGGHQAEYERGIASLEMLALNRFGHRFAALDAADQDALLSEMESGTAEGFAPPGARAMFDLLRRHVMEGFFADPMYGGNRDCIGAPICSKVGCVRHAPGTPTALSNPSWCSLSRNWKVYALVTSTSLIFGSA